jgi:hypothetical protein
MGLLLGQKSDPAGLWAWVWERITRIRKPMGFQKPGPHYKSGHIATYQPNNLGPINIQYIKQKTPKTLT